MTMINVEDTKSAGVLVRIDLQQFGKRSCLHVNQEFSGFGVDHVTT